MTALNISGTLANQAVTDQTTIAPFINVVITDDPGQIETVSVTLSTTANGDLSNLGGGSYNAVTGVYTTTGDAATVTSDLNGLVFTPVTGTPGQSVTTTFSISDTDTALTNANDSQTSVVATGAIPGPTIVGTTAGQTVTDQSPIAPFSNVGLQDIAGQDQTVTVTLSDPANGSLSRLGGGNYNAATGVYTDSGSTAAVNTDLFRLLFTPSAGTPGQSVTTTFTISDTDTAAVNATDNTTSVTNTTSIPVPFISGTQAGQTVANQTTIMPFSGVTITDADGQTDTVTVTLSSPADGSLGNLGGGSYDSGTGTYTVSGDAAAVTAALIGLVFTPRTVAPGGSVTTTFTISDTNTASGNSSDSTTSVTDSNPIGVPSISLTRPDQRVTDQTTINPFTGVLITDLSAQPQTVTVTLSSAVNGGLSNLGGGSYDATTGMYTISGSVAAVTSALHGLVFTPTAGEVPLGHTVITHFTISDANGGPATATDSGTSVSATAVAPPTRTFTITNTATGITTTTNGTPYTGPVAGIQSEFVTNTASALAITATVPNMFIHTGSGNDAIDVSHVNGTNVLDGSTGSNFLVGGTGFDTFYLDDRNPSADVFSTVVNFHSGDNATVWGVTTSDFHLNLFDNQGAAGYTGLDFSFTAAGHANANVVLAGFSSADLTNGRLSVTYGTTPAAGGTSGSTYMLIHAN